MNKAIVKSVDPGSIAEECGIVPGDAITKVNNIPIRDILDFRYLTSDYEYVVEVLKADGSTEEIEIVNELYEQFGCEFESELIDDAMRCRNKCIFCFMDQLPCGMRDTMYFKDDDVRLSFFEGNYVTLTNLSDEDVDRICHLKISPVNVSVHTTNSELRCKMLGNRFAGKLLGIMRRFADSGIIMNGQIVLCKGINDGDELRKTLSDLRDLYPAVQSVSVVPVGLTAYRDGLYELQPFEKDDCAAVIDLVSEFTRESLKKIGTRLVYLADEFYIKAKRPLPSYDEYEDFPQIENGVGMVTNFMYEVDEALDEFDFSDVHPSPKSVATGFLAYESICEAVDRIKEKVPSLNVNVYRIKNNFFGERITVTGLLCGCDLTKQLENADIGEYLVLSRSMFKSDCDITLDDMTAEQIEERLGVKLIICADDGREFVRAMINY